MKRIEKLILAILATASLVGCGSDDRARSARVPSDGGGIVTTQPVGALYTAGGSLSFLSDNEYNLTVREFLTTAPDQNPYEIDMGFVLNRTDVEKRGVKIELHFASGSLADLANMDSDDIGLDIFVYDDYVLDQGLDPFLVSFNPNTATSLGQEIEVFKDGSILISFYDELGDVWVEGRYVNDTFQGSIYFENTYNDFGGILSEFVMNL